MDAERVRTEHACGETFCRSIAEPSGKMAADDVNAMHRQSAPRPLDVWAYGDFVIRFHDETDRAAAVLAGAYLDTFLADTLRAVFVTGARTDGLFDAQGALGSLRSKISLAVALGLVTEALARDMDLVRKVRNYFAHHIWDASFDAPPVSDWCRAISVVDTAVDQTTGESVRCERPARHRYLLAVGISTLMVAYSPKMSADFRKRVTGIRGLEKPA